MKKVPLKKLQLFVLFCFVFKKGSIIKYNNTFKKKLS